MDIIEKAKNRRAADAQRFAQTNQDVCMLCRAQGPDKRTLMLKCFYDLHEVSEEFITLYDVAGTTQDNEAEIPHALRNFYYLRICKNCRGELLNMLRAWAELMISRRPLGKSSDGYIEEPHSDELIVVRRDGRTVWITPEEYGR